MKKNLALMVPLGLLTALAACADNQSFMGASSYNPSYLPGEHELYGPIQTFVRGGPFPALAATDQTAPVIADMQDGGFPLTNFTTETVGRSPYRVLMVFSPTPGTGLEQLCAIDPRSIAGLPMAPPPSDGRIGLAAVFCRAGELMGGTNGTLPTGTVDSPVVKGSIQAFMRQLFPATNPTAGGGAGSDPP